MIVNTIPLHYGRLWIDIASQNIANANVSNYTAKQLGGSPETPIIEDTNEPVDLAKELIELRIATVYYKANALAIKTKIELYDYVLDLFV